MRNQNVIHKFAPLTFIPVSMKDITRKLTRYSSAVGALLAVSANAQATPYIGKITGSDGNTILNHLFDEVFIDIDNDGTDEFVGVMYSTTSTTSSILYKYRIVLFGGMSSNAVVELDSSSSWALKKFALNDMIGPLANSSVYGFVAGFSGPASPGAPLTPLGSGFTNNDAGYIGVGLTSTSGTRYGWVQISISSVADVEFVAAGLETTLNTPIPAGNGVPVPLLPIASAAGLGLVGLMAALKRRKKNVTI